MELASWRRDSEGVLCVLSIGVSTSTSITNTTNKRHLSGPRPGNIPFAFTVSNRIQPPRRETSHLPDKVSVLAVISFH